MLVFLTTLVLLAAPREEVLREERYNYRVLGTMPAGWSRDKVKLVFTYKFEDVPHAYIHFNRERIAGKVDVRDELGRRRESYRFPGISDLRGEKAVESFREIQWAGRDAWQYEHTATVHGVKCRRVVRALFDQGDWYECIETHHGEANAAARAGFACFRGGFRLLVDALPKDQQNDPAARTYTDADNGFRIDKPEGWTRIAVRSASDPGCRIAFERRGPGTDDLLVVRVFEYGVRRKGYQPEVWIQRFADAFKRNHIGAADSPWKPPSVEGSREAHGIRLTGRRDKASVVTEIALYRSNAYRVIGVRITAFGDAATKHTDSLKKLLTSLRLTD